MLKKVLLAVVALLIAFSGYVATRPGHFKYERSLVIQAPAEKIFPYLRDFKLGAQWNPYDQKDPQMKHAFSGADSGVGAVLDFEGNSDAGTGRLEVLREVPNSQVELRLTMLKPFQATNTVLYTLVPEGAGTRMIWSLSGDGGFISKLMSTLINCEKMVGDDLEKGLANLNRIMTAQK